MEARFTITGDRTAGPPVGLTGRLAYLVAQFQQLLVDKGYTIGNGSARVDRVNNNYTFVLETQVSINQDPTDPMKYPEYIAHEFRVLLYANNYNVTSLIVTNSG